MNWGPKNGVVFTSGFRDHCRGRPAASGGRFYAFTKNVRGGRGGRLFWRAWDGPIWDPAPHPKKKPGKVDPSVVLDWPECVPEAIFAELGRRCRSVAGFGTWIEVFFATRPGMGFPPRASIRPATPTNRVFRYPHGNWPWFYNIRALGANSPSKDTASQTSWAPKPP